jgi:hypothetical protein
VNYPKVEGDGEDARREVGEEEDIDPCRVCEVSLLGKGVVL